MKKKCKKRLPRHQTEAIASTLAPQVIGEATSQGASSAAGAALTSGAGSTGGFDMSQLQQMMGGQGGNMQMPGGIGGNPIQGLVTDTTAAVKGIQGATNAKNSKEGWKSGMVGGLAIGKNLQKLDYVMPGLGTGLMGASVLGFGIYGGVKGRKNELEFNQAEGKRISAENNFAMTQKRESMENPNAGQIYDNPLYSGKLGGMLDFYAKGGIHINPENKGKFSAFAAKHGWTTQEAARKVMANKGKYSSEVVKRANFARNAAKWKHEYGGEFIPNYAFGGNLNDDDVAQEGANAVFDHNETIQTPSGAPPRAVAGGEVEQLANGMYKMNGQNPNITDDIAVEAEQGTYIWSDSIYVPKIVRESLNIPTKGKASFAKISEELMRKKGSFEAKLNNKDNTTLSKQTINKNISNVDKKLQALRMVQEQLAPKPKEQQQQGQELSPMAYGGWLPRHQMGNPTQVEYWQKKIIDYQTQNNIPILGDKTTGTGYTTKSGAKYMFHPGIPSDNEQYYNDLIKDYPVGWNKQAQQQAAQQQSPQGVGTFGGEGSVSGSQQVQYQPQAIQPVVNNTPTQNSNNFAGSNTYGQSSPYDFTGGVLQNPQGNWNMLSGVNSATPNNVGVTGGVNNQTGNNTTNSGSSQGVYWKDIANDAMMYAPALSYLFNALQKPEKAKRSFIDNIKYEPITKEEERKEIRASGSAFRNKARNYNEKMAIQNNMTTGLNKLYEEERNINTEGRMKVKGMNADIQTRNVALTNEYEDIDAKNRATKYTNWHQFAKELKDIGSVSKKDKDIQRLGDRNEYELEKKYGYKSGDFEKWLDNKYASKSKKSKKNTNTKAIK